MYKSYNNRDYYKNKMKQLTILFCLLAIATLANSLNLQHTADFHVDTLPGHKDLISHISKITLTNDRIGFKGCNFNNAAWSQKGG